MSENTNNNIIKAFNVTINGDSANSHSYEVGADAKNVQFSSNATAPFKNETVEDNIPVGIVEKAENRIYGNAYIKNNDWDDIPGTPDFGPSVDDIQTDRTNDGAGALTITYGFNSLAKGHHSTAIGFDCEAKGWASHAEGWKTNTGDNSNCSHAEGAKTNALHNMAHAEGDGATAAGYGSHAEGRGTFAYGVGSHVEGMGSNVGSANSVAWQDSNTLHGYEYDTVEGSNNASNNDVCVELTYPKQIRNGQLSHAEGLNHTVIGACCHAEGMYNTIDSVYASTAMGEANSIHSNTSVAMGYQNTLNSGADNSLILGYNNVNPGYPNSLFLGKNCAMGSSESNPPAFVIGSGDEITKSNLITIRHPQVGVASVTNKGELWGKNIDAHFATITQGPLYLRKDVDKAAFYMNERPLYIYKNGVDGIQPITMSLCTDWHFTSQDQIWECWLPLDPSHDWRSDPNITASTTIRFTRAVFSIRCPGEHEYIPLTLTPISVMLQTGGGTTNLRLLFDSSAYRIYATIISDAQLNKQKVYTDVVVFGYTY